MARYKIQRQYIFSNKSYNQISQFLKEYPNINIKQIQDHKKNTALHQAAYNNEDIRILKKYLQYMEKYYAENDKTDPQNNFKEFVNFRNQDGLTALHFAAYKGNYKAMELLCNYGADYTKKTTSGQNVLHMAAQGGQVQAFIYFQSLIDINQQDSKQSTALHWASYMNNQSIATFLLACSNIKINAQDINKQTALHLATSYGHTKIVKKLLRAGADRTIKNLNSQTAIKIARDNQFRNIEGLLNEQHNFLDYFKLYLNLKTQYKPEKRSLKKPFIYILSLAMILGLRIFLFKQEQGKQYIRYIQYGLYGILLLLYCSLLTPPSKIHPKKYIDFLNGNINIKKVCLTCAQIKPSRSQHCDICKKCIQRYDHHCFWINNCVGTINIGRFIAFIFLFQVYLFYVIGFTMIVLIGYFKNDYSIIQVKNQEYEIYCVIYAFAIGLFSLGFSFPMLGLIIVHIKNLLLNKTTFERFTKQKISNLTQSTSHLLQDQIKPNKVRKYSLSNARTMCRDDQEINGTENINSSLVNQHK